MMTKEELYKVNNYDLEKTMKVWKFLQEEEAPVEKIRVRVTVPTAAIGVVAATLPFPTGKVHLITKDGIRLIDKNTIKKLHLSTKDVKGISIPLPDGTETIVSPVWTKAKLLSESATTDRKWKGKEYKECEALYQTIDEAIKASRELKELNSEAAKFAEKVANGDSSWHLPSFTECGAIVRFREEYNEFVKLLEDGIELPKDDYYGSSCRSSTNIAWFFSGCNGYASNYYFYNSLVVLSCLRP